MGRGSQWHMVIRFYILTILFFGCQQVEKPGIQESSNNGLELLVLGTVQDAGSPHIACKKDCCKDLFKNPDPSRKVVSLGLIDHDNKETFLFEATPDITTQIKGLTQTANFGKEVPDGVFLTHAHIGHYAGLMYFGKEAMNAKQVRTYVMPRFKSYLANNGPWSQLVNDKNINLTQIIGDSAMWINSNLLVMALQVPHRDEYSETVGYIINGPNKAVLFIPDIDKWSKWKVNILKLIDRVDYAFLDATFFDGEEINNRDISEIPHPFVIESMELFSNLDANTKEKIHFIHFNHTNPLLNKESDEHKLVKRLGFNIASINQKFKL